MIVTELYLLQFKVQNKTFLNRALAFISVCSTFAGANTGIEFVWQYPITEPVQPVVFDLQFFNLVQLIFILQKSFLLRYSLILQNKHSANKQSIENSGLSYISKDHNILKEVLIWCK